MSEKKIRRIISVFLVLAMVFSIFAGMDIVPLNAGDKDNSGSIANCRIEYTDDKVIYTNNTGVVKVTVAAGKDVFPDGTKMELKDTDKNEVIDKANLQITESDEEYRLKNAIGVDINFIDPNGTVTEPEQSKVQVEIELIKDELNGEVTDVLHVVNDKAVKVTEGVKVTDNKADFVTESFSTYIIATKIGEQYKIDSNGCGYVAQGETLQLRLQSSQTTDANPNPKVVTEGVTWRSSDPTKATVDASGLVTGVENSENHVINIIATYKGRDYIRTLAVIFKHYKLNIYSQSNGYLSGTDLNNSYSLVGVQDVIEDQVPVEPVHKDYVNMLFVGWYGFNDSNNNNIPDSDEIDISPENKYDFKDETIKSDTNICAVYTDLNTCIVNIEYVAVYGEEKTIKLAPTYRIEAFLDNEGIFYRPVPIPDFNNRNEENYIILADDSEQKYLNAKENSSCHISLDRDMYTINLSLTADEIRNNGTLSFKVVFTGTEAKYTVNHYLEDPIDPDHPSERTYTKEYVEEKQSIVHTYTDAEPITDAYPVSAELVDLFREFEPGKVVDVEVANPTGTVVDIYYKRKSYTLSFASTGDSVITSKVLEFRAPITVNTDQADENFGAIRLKQSDGATIDIDPPKREGYQFKGWQFTYMEHGVEIEMDAPDKMRGHDIKATAVWEANQMVDYTIVYWQQKAVVKSDDMEKYPVDTNTYNSLIENYNYADSKVVTKGAKIGSKTSDLIAELEADTSDSGIKNKYPDTGKITYIYESSVGNSGELKIDGSTTINVFYNREIITYNVNWSGVSITDDVSHLNKYTGLEGAAIQDYYPGFEFDTRYIWRYRERGKTTDTTNTLLSAFVDVENNTNFTVESRTQYYSKVVHFIENKDGTFSLKSEVALSAAPPRGTSSFSITNKFNGYTAKGYRIVSWKNEKSQSDYENDYRTPNTETSSGYSTQISGSKTVGAYESIQVYHYRDSGYRIDMYTGKSVGTSTMIETYNNNLCYGDSVWEAIKSYCESKGYTAESGYEPEEPAKVKKDNQDSDPTNDWQWMGWYMIPDPEYGTEAGKYSETSDVTFSDSLTVRIFAVWKPPQCEIIFIDPSGINENHVMKYDKYSYVSPSDLYDGNQLTPPVIANTLEGTTAKYVFDGWYYDRNYSVKYDTSRKIDRTPNELYAKWLLTGKIRYNVVLYNNKGEKIGYEIVEVSAAGTYDVIGLTDIDGNEYTGATKRVYVDADLIKEEVTAYLAEDVWVYQVYCICEDGDVQSQITGAYYGTTYEEKYITAPTIDGYMFTGYSNKGDGGRMHQSYQMIKKSDDYKSTGTGYVDTPQVYFYYKKIKNIPVKIEYYKENDNGTYDKDESATVNITSDAGVTKDFMNYDDGSGNITNYAPDDKYAGYYMAVAPIDLQKTISSDSAKNVIGVYYRYKYGTVTFENRDTNYQMYLAEDDSSITMVTEKVKYNDQVDKPFVYGKNRRGTRYSPIWYTEDDKEFDFTSKITSDVKLHAVWSQIPDPSYTLDIEGIAKNVSYNGQEQFLIQGIDNIEEAIPKFELKYHSTSIFGTINGDVDKKSFDWKQVDGNKNYIDFTYEGNYTANGVSVEIKLEGQYRLKGMAGEPIKGIDSGKYYGEIVLTKATNRYFNRDYDLLQQKAIEIVSDPGYLNINPVPLAIGTDNYTCEYDGTEHTKKSGWVNINNTGTEPLETDMTSKNLLGSDVMNYEITGIRIDAGTVDNNITINNIMGDRNGTLTDVSKNYIISYDVGKITVTKSTADWIPDVEITSVDTKVDGNYHGISIKDKNPNQKNIYFISYDSDVYEYIRNPKFKDPGYYEMEVVVANPNYIKTATVKLDKDNKNIHVYIYSDDITPAGFFFNGLPYIILVAFGLIMMGIRIRLKKKKTPLGSGNEVM